MIYSLLYYILLYLLMITDIEEIPISSFPGNIYIIHDLIQNTFCENMRNLIDQQATHNSMYSNTNSVKAYVTVLNDINVDNIFIKQDISLLLSGYIRAIPNIISKIRPNIFQNFIPTISTIEFRKIYGETKQHIDNISADNSRILTCIIMLNDDYDDGIFSFPDQNVNFKPKKGDVILFPPYWTHPHRVSTPNNGFRYTIAFWYKHHSDNDISIS